MGQVGPDAPLHRGRPRPGRFARGDRLGYGYGGKALSLELHNQNSLNWTSLYAADYDNASEDAQAIFDRYGTQYRRGRNMEAGAEIRLGRNFAVSVGLEGASVGYCLLLKDDMAWSFGCETPLTVESFELGAGVAPAFSFG